MPNADANEPAVDSRPLPASRRAKWAARILGILFCAALATLIAGSMNGWLPSAAFYAGGAVSLAHAAVDLLGAAWAFALAVVTGSAPTRGPKLKRSMRLLALCFLTLGLISLTLALLRDAPAQPPTPPPESEPPAAMSDGELTFALVMIIAGVVLLLLGLRNGINNVILGEHGGDMSLRHLLVGPTALFVYGVCLLTMSISWIITSYSG